MEEIREVLHFENSIEHKILITYVIAKVSIYIYIKTLVTVVTVVTALESSVVIGFVGNHTQIFTWLPLVTSLPFRA